MLRQENSPREQLYNKLFFFFEENYRISFFFFFLNKFVALIWTLTNHDINIPV